VADPSLPSPPAGEGDQPARPDPIPLAAVALLTAFALYQAVAANNFQDFFIYRAGAAVGLRGESPYDDTKVRALVAQQYPDDDRLIANCGFFLPPAAVVLFAPFAAVPYPAAKVLWAVVTGLAGLGCLAVLRTFGRAPGSAGRPAAALVAFGVLVAPTLTLPTVIVGQTTLLFVGCVAAGQWCFERGRPAVGALLWAVPFLKPHLALPLLPLAWYLGGWRRAAAVAGVVAGLNLLGCLIAGGSPLFVREYLDFLASGHKGVVFNRAEMNPQVTSWNRLLFAAGGPLAELGAATTLGGYLVWFGLLGVRASVAPARPSPAWAAAAAAAGAVLCSQVLGYEVLVLTLAVPWVLDLFASGRWVRAAAAVALLLVQWVPYPQYLAWIESLHLAGRWEMLALSYRSAGVALFALLVLTGPVAVSRDPQRR
jgi:hypothetical protein